VASAKALTDAAALLQTEKARADKAVAESVALKARLDAIDASAAKSARTALEAKATAAGVTPVAGQTDRALKEAVVLKLDGAACPAGSVDAYVDARFDIATAKLKVEGAPAGSEILQALHGKPAPRADATDVTAESDPLAYIALMSERASNLHARSEKH
jgi:hypothetical protein